MARPSPQTARLILVVDLLASDPGRGRSLADLARHLDLDKATCLPMLRELVVSGWLVRMGPRKEYRLGPALIDVGRAAATGQDIVDLAGIHMTRLANELDEAVAAVTPTADALIVSEIVQPRSGRRRVSLRISDRFYNRPPVGSVFAAFADPTEQEEWLGRRASPDQDEVRDYYLRALGEIRDRGYAIEHNTADIASEFTITHEFDRRYRHSIFRGDESAALADSALLDSIDPARTHQIFNVAAPVLDGSGRPLLAIVVLLDHTTHRTTAEIERMGRAVALAAESASHALTPRRSIRVGGERQA
jgi:DNA-binding IclR family transcriptional regulator